MALTGTFEDIGFAELLQLLNMGHKSGKLFVRRESEAAELFIRDGEVARACFRLERGPEVVYRILGWTTGDFRFERCDQAPWAKEIHESTEALILEGMKRFDEWEQVEANGPTMHLVLRQRISAVNERYETLSDQARRVVRLVDARRHISQIVRESGLEPQEALQAVRELIEQEFVEEWAEPSESPKVLQAEGHLPAARGGIEYKASFVSSGGQLSRKGGRRKRSLKGGDSAPS